MLNEFSRTELLLGKEAMDKLQNSRVAVFGIGGVGGYVCEALVRSGIGAFDLIDDDATLYVVGAQALINYTKRQRGAP